MHTGLNWNLDIPIMICGVIVLSIYGWKFWGMFSQAISQVFMRYILLWYSIVVISIPVIVVLCPLHIYSQIQKLEWSWKFPLSHLHTNEFPGVSFPFVYRVLFQLEIRCVFIFNSSGVPTTNNAILLANLSGHVRSIFSTFIIFIFIRLLSWNTFGTKYYYE